MTQTHSDFLKKKLNEIVTATQSLQKFRAQLLKVEKYATDKAGYTKRFTKRIAEQQLDINFLSRDNQALHKHNAELRKNSDPAWFFIALLITEGAELWDSELLNKMAHKAGLLYRVNMKSPLNSDVQKCDKCQGDCEFCYRVTNTLLSGVQLFCDVQTRTMLKKLQRRKNGKKN